MCPGSSSHCHVSCRAAQGCCHVCKLGKPVSLHVPTVLGQGSIPGYFLRRQKPFHMNFCWVIKWAEKFLRVYASLIFRFGYHWVPSIRQLHLHVVSQDFGSPHLKNKKHWNSFNTFFFCDSTDVIEEAGEHGEATLNKDDKLLSMELRCRRCKSMHPRAEISHC